MIKNFDTLNHHITHKIIEKKGYWLSNIIQNWHNIATASWYHHTIPYKISTRSQNHILKVAVDHNTSIQNLYYTKLLIIKKINMYCGFLYISDIQFSNQHSYLVNKISNNSL